MKLTTRGFTLVELMIVIAIIGILAAALFPSLTAYLKRSRDAARTSHLKDISNAVGAYYSDNERYPNGDTNVSTGGCLWTGVLSTSYLEGTYPIDPQPSSTRNNGCASPNYYSYASGVVALTNYPHFLLGAVFENQNGGNMTNGTGQLTALMGYNGTPGAGTGILGSTEIAWLDNSVNVKKGNGSGYIIYK